jgi:hypothetical protein
LVSGGNLLSSLSLDLLLMGGARLLIVRPRCCGFFVKGGSLLSAFSRNLLPLHRCVLLILPRPRRSASFVSDGRLLSNSFSSNLLAPPLHCTLLLLPLPRRFDGSWVVRGSLLPDFSPDFELLLRWAALLLPLLLRLSRACVS